MSRSQEPRTLAALAATVFAAALVPVLGAGTASATTAECNAATVQYRIVGADGNVVGADWTSEGGFLQWTTVPGTVQVRLAPGQTVADGCTYPVSLAEYTTEGPNWYTSGHQTMVDKATVYLTKDDLAGADDKGRTWQKLSVKSPDCYGQIDLYGDDIAYDGKTGTGHGPLPYQPGNVNTPYHLIAAWNGGDKECAPGTPESPTPSETPPTSPATPSTPPAGSTPPVDTPPTTPAPSTTPPTTPDVPPMTTPPNTPEPKSSPSGPPLAETGSSAPVGAIAGGAALVVALGAGALYAGRRTRRS